MKHAKLITFIITVVIFSATLPVMAQTSQPSRTPTPVEEKEASDEAAKAVEELKEKVESKVTELKNTSLKTKAGFISEIEDGKITVDGATGPFSTVIDGDVTTIYRISGTSRTEIDEDDLEEGDYILVTGPEIGNEVTANTINVDEHYISKSGKIIEVNSDDFYVELITLEKDTYIIDIERTTTSQILDIKTLKLETAGFTKLKEGDNIHFTAKRSDDATETRFSAIKTIVIPQEYFIK